MPKLDIKDLRYQEMLAYAKTKMTLGRWPKKTELITLLHEAGIYTVSVDENLVPDELDVSPDENLTVEKQAEEVKAETATRETREADDVNKTTSERVTEEVILARRERRDMDGGDLKLHVDESQKDPDYHYAFVNDEANRIERKESRDWEKVEKAGGGHDVRLVGTKKEGGPLSAYLMRIRKEFHEDDYRQKQKDIDLVEDAIKRGEDNNGEVGKEGRYIPDEYTGGIRVQTEQR